ncbi:hypothetical protein EON78_01265 [bacterium]|nr:MAG: hypothetical protein EON78_01265 [bacterium]
MKIISKNTLLLLVTSSILMSCAVSNDVTTVNPNRTDSLQSVNQGNVKFRLDFPAKFTNNQINGLKGFSTKALDVAKINRVKIKVESATTSFVIERNVDLVPGGIEATIGLPLDKLYTVTVQGMNDTTNVSGSEIKGYFSLMTASQTPTVEVSQATGPIAKIIEGLKARASEFKSTTSTTTGTTSPVSGTTTGGTTEKDTPSTPSTAASAGQQIVTPENEFKLADIDLVALNDVVERARINAHPSLINVASFVDSIVKNKAVPFEVPSDPLLKAGTLKGTITGLKANEVAIVTVGDPSSKQTIVVTPPIVSKLEDTEVDPDELSDPISFVIDNITPGAWEAKVMASGYTQSVNVSTLNIEAGKETTSSFTVQAGSWLITPKNISGSVGNSDQANTFKDEIDNIHAVWRQDGFDTDTNSGVINYSRWNGTSWTTQAINVSQNNQNNLRGSRDPGVVVGLDRLPQVIWSAKDSSGNRKVYFNKFNGTTWQVPSVISGSENGINTSLTVDKTNGYLYAVWEANETIYLSQYDRTNWSVPVNIGSGSLPKVNMGSDSVVHIVWKNMTSQKLQYANWTQSNGPSQIEDLPMSSLGSDILNSIDTSIDRFNRLHVVWRNDIYVQYILRSNVSWSQPEIVNRVPNVLMSARSGASLSVSPTGIVNVAWVSTGTGNKEVIRFRRRLSDGWKNPFMRINDPTEPIQVNPETEEAETPETIKKSENIDGYEDIPLSGISSVVGKPLIVADGLGKINVIWSNRGQNSDDTDLLHSLKTIETAAK